MKWILSAVLILVFPVLLWAHAFYVSVIKVEYNSLAQALEIKVQTFTDDLENALLKKGYEAPGLLSGEHHADINTYIEEYIKSTFDLKIDGERLPIYFTKKEIDEEAVFSHFRVENVAPFSAIEVRATLLMELFDDQTNIVRFNLGDEKKFVNLTKQVSSERVKF